MRDSAPSSERQGTGDTRLPALQLVALAAAILYLELAIIRFTSAQVLYLGYFSNFILISAFVGLGLGFLAARRTIELGPFVPFVLLFLFALALVTEFDVDLLRNRGGLYFFGNRVARPGLPSWVLLPALFLATVALFAGLAQQAARLFERFAPLQAYTLDIAGSLLGIALFSLQSYLWSGPVIWVATGSLLLGVAHLAARSWGKAIAIGLGGLAVLLLLLAVRPAGEVLWSTYQKLELRALREQPAVKAIFANGIVHQFIQSARSVARSYYQTPYDVHRSAGGALQHVMIIGAGSGTDVALALANGAASVDAVEIDDGIVDLGRAHHPDRPYSDARVKVHVADGRQFLRNTNGRYDLIIFALPDSLVLLSSMSSLRLESFLFTLESFREARARLNAGGTLVLYNQYRWEWLKEKIASMLEQVFGHPPRRIESGSTTVFAAGGGARGNSAATAASAKSLRPATDDWPFLYMKRPGLTWPYLGVIAMFLLASLLGVALLAPRGTLRRPDWPFFFMGAAFLLLETKSISLFSLLFGSTWMVNSLAFGGVLLSVLVANLTVRRFEIRRRALPFVALFGSLALAYVVPPAALLGVETTALRYLCAILLVFSPIFLANLIFSREFRDTDGAPRSFGWNLLGAVAGGGLEYVSLLVGHRNLLWIVAGCYLLTGLLLARGRRARTSP